MTLEQGGKLFFVILLGAMVGMLGGLFYLVVTGLAAFLKGEFHL
jgi:hypothetical protein